MRFKPFTQRLRRNSYAGFSLVELLVTMFIASIMMTMMTGFFRATVGTRHDMGLQTEAQQGVRALLEMISQELRQAGACLPKTGQFIALSGTNDGEIDALTLRIGRTERIEGADSDILRCVKAGTNATVTGSATLPLGPGEGDLFSNAALVYITPTGATGDFYAVVSTTTDSVTIDESVNLPAGAGVYAIDERIYQVETIDGREALTVRIDGGAPYPLVDGVEKFDVAYWLESDAIPDTLEEAPVDFPEDDTEWRRVRMLTLATKVQARKTKRDGNELWEEGHIDVKPRNLL